MDIDLFISPYGECGLLCNQEFDNLPAGVIFDAETLELTVEFLEEAPFHLNITTEEELRERILLAKKLYIGFLRDGLIAETIEVPLLYLNDPYGSDFDGQGALVKPSNSMVAFEQFMKRSTSAQPIHREDLGNEDSRGSVLCGMDPKQMEFVPQLVRQRLMEMTPQGPAAGPSGAQIPPPMPKGPGGMSMGGGSQRRMPPRQTPANKSDDDT